MSCELVITKTYIRVVQMCTPFSEAASHIESSIQPREIKWVVAHILYIPLNMHQKSWSVVFFNNLTF